MPAYTFEPPYELSAIRSLAGRHQGADIAVKQRWFGLWWQAVVTVPDRQASAFERDLAQMDEDMAWWHAIK